MLITGVLRRGARRLDTVVPHERAGQSAYARMMRECPGFAHESVTAHVIRWLPKDYPIFAGMLAGDQYPQAVDLAEAMLTRKLRELPPHMQLEGDVCDELRARIVPPHDLSKFPNKRRKMEPGAPASTLHLGKDSYSHIHYDSSQARTIAVCQAARLQAFSDGFQFRGSMNDGVRQIGNAVPPLLAYALARHLRGLHELRQQPDFHKRVGLLGRPTKCHIRAR